MYVPQPLRRKLSPAGHINRPGVLGSHRPVRAVHSKRMEDAKSLVNGYYAKKTGKTHDGVSRSQTAMIWALSYFHTPGKS